MKNNDNPLPKKMKRITENDVMLNNETNDVPLPKKNDKIHRKWPYAK